MVVVRQAGSSNWEYSSCIALVYFLCKDGRRWEGTGVRYASSLSQAKRQRGEQGVGLGNQVVCEAQYRRVSCCLTRVEGHP